MNIEEELKGLILTFYPRTVVRRENAGMEIREIDSGELTQESVQKLKVLLGNFLAQSYREGRAEMRKELLKEAR